MKQSDITERIIELSREIAKYWRMEIYEGCWIYDEVEERLVLFGKDTQLILNGKLLTYSLLIKSDTTKELAQVTSGKFFPIPSISDALGKLRELDWCIEMTYICEPKIELNYVKGGERFKQIKAEGNTLHETLLSALLKMMKGEGK